jgi:hypothetical protein
LGLVLPGAELSTKYDGSPVLQVGGAFMAGIATHWSAEPGTLVVRLSLEDREHFLDDAPDTYYITEHYRPFPVVLVRLAAIESDPLRELLAMSWRLTLPKARPRRNRAQRPV